MKQDTPRGIHVAIIMDGNGRYNRAGPDAYDRAHRGRPHGTQDRRGCPSCGIGTLTLYAFSADITGGAPPERWALLMRLFRRYLVSEVARCVTNGVRMRIIGRRDRIPPELLRAITAAEHATRQGRTLDLRIAVDYSARDAIVRAARRGAGIRPDVTASTGTTLPSSCLASTTARVSRVTWIF